MRRRTISRQKLLTSFYFLLLLPCLYYFFEFRKIAYESGIDSSKSVGHPLDNSCKYPILNPNDPNLEPYVQHGQRLVCPINQPEFVKLDDGVLWIDRKLVQEKLPHDLECYYRPVAGGVKPKTVELEPLANWSKIENESSERQVFVSDDIVEVRCYASSKNPTKMEKLLHSQPPSKSDNETDFRYAFAQIGRPVPSAFVEDVDQNRNPKYGLDILVLDSTSLNMFRRHASKSWEYMKNRMGFFHFDGYTRVADNSLVNLIPLLAGLRYRDSADDLPSDLPTDVPLESDEVPFLWNLFKASNCATMFNDDIAHWSRGFWNYPRDWTPGFAKPPADHFFRPWNIYHRRYPIPNNDRFCFGARPYYKDMIRLTEQMIARYRDRCHFSFNFITDLTHDDSNNLEYVDDYLLATLQRLYERSHLKNTILVVMGDHGNRINLIRFRYVGRIEERMAFFSVYFPPSFHRRYPELVKNLRLNQHRLISHFDSHQMFRDILLSRFDDATPDVQDEWSSKRKGISLFKPIPAQRTCKEANIPENHCTCLMEARKFNPESNLNDSKLLNRSKELISTWTNDRCQTRGRYPILITSISALTTTQLVQHGVRHLTEDVDTMAKVKKRTIVGDIEYLEITYEMRDGTFKTKNRASAVIRLQYDRKLDQLSINVKPKILYGPTSCNETAQRQGCACIFDCVLYCS